MVHFSSLSATSSFATPFWAGPLRWMIEPQRERSSISPCPFLLVVDNTAVLTASIYQNNSVGCVIFRSDVEKHAGLKDYYGRKH